MLVTRTDAVSVPTGTGVAGLVQTVTQLLQEIPRVHSVTVTPGRVTYTWDAMETQEDTALDVPFELLHPYDVLRRVTLFELPAQVAHPVVDMTQRCTAAGLYPICFVASPDSVLRTYMQAVYGIVVVSELWGYPVLTDARMPENALALLAGVGRSVLSTDATAAWKCTMEGA